MKNLSILTEEFLEIGNLKSIKIIDMHTHMGGFYGLSLPNSKLKNMLATMKRLNIEFIVSVPNSALFDPDAGNREIQEAMAEHPEKIYGYYAVNPNLKNNIIAIDEAIKANSNYRGFKFLPDYHRYPLNGKNYELVLKYADDNHLTVLSHTWGVAMDGHSYSSVETIKDVLKNYKNINFIMGHSIQGQCDEAIDIAKEYPNAYLELTDTYRLNGMIEKMVNNAGSEKILFGTDLPWYNPAYCLGCILFSNIGDIDKKNIIRNNALRILKV